MSRLRRPKKTTNTSGVEFDCFSRPSCFFFPLHTRRVESAHGTYTCRWCRWSGNIVECRRLTEECHAKTTLADERKHTSQSVSRGSERIKKNDRVSCACLQLVRLPSVAIPLIFKLASCVFASWFFVATSFICSTDCNSQEVTWCVLRIFMSLTTLTRARILASFYSHDVRGAD